MAMISNSSKAKDFVEFMSVRRENGEKKVVMIVDNAKNKAKISKKLKS